MLEIWHLSATCLNYSYPVWPDVLVGVCNFCTYIAWKFQLANWLRFQLSMYSLLSSFYMWWYLFFFKWYKKGELSKAFKCWRIAGILKTSLYCGAGLFLIHLNILNTNFDSFTWAKTWSTRKSRISVMNSSLVWKSCRQAFHLQLVKDFFQNPLSFAFNKDHN